MDGGPDQLLRIGLGGLVVGLLVLFGSAFQPVGRLSGIGIDTLRQVGISVTVLAAIVVRLRWTPSG
jgi:hypothetical protein